MITRIIQAVVALFILTLSVALGGCDASAEEVRAADMAFDAALDSRNGAKAATFLSKGSIERLDQLVNLARTAKKAEVKALPFTDRYAVLRMRLLFKPKELKAMDGRAYAVKMVDMGKQGSTSKYTRGNISVNSTKTRATMTLTPPNSDESRQVVWIFEDGAWKADEVSEAQLANDWIADRLREVGMSEEEFLMRRLQRVSDGDVPESIWDPSR